MTYITLQFGQCGNQLGEELFSLAFSDTASSTLSYWQNTCGRDSWFHHTSKNKFKARSVLIDSENKVISSISRTTKSCHWSYDSGNVVTVNQGGAGNNFAVGYCVTGPQVKDDVLEVLRKECEKCDRLGGILGLGSCGGGTGSGLGTFLLQQVKDSYPNKNLISVLVTPHTSGDAVTQNINMLFAVSMQNDVCDALVMVENDSILNLIQHHHRLKNSTFSDLNKIISMNILPLLQPLEMKTRRVGLHDVLSNLCFHPSYKCVTTQSFPLMQQSRSKFDAPPSWTLIERDMIRFLKSSSHSPTVDFVNSVSNVAISRGLSVPASILTKVRSAFLPADWVPPNFAFHHYHNPRQLLNQEISFTVISNSSKICGLLDSCISKSWKLFTNKMHTHHYYKFGFEEKDFTDSFVKSEQLLKAYSSLQ